MSDTAPNGAAPPSGPPGAPGQASGDTGALIRRPAPERPDALSVADANALLRQRRAAPDSATPPAAGDGANRPRGRPPREARTNGATAPAAPTPSAANGAAGHAQPAAPSAAGDPFSSLADLLRAPPAGAAAASGSQPTATPAPAAGPAAGGEPGAITLTVEGRQQSFSPTDLAQHVERGLDYTRKTQGIAEQARLLSEQQATIAQILPLIVPELERQARALEGVARPDPALLDTDPVRYHRERAQWEQAQDERNRLAQLQAVQTQTSHRALAEQIDASHRMLSERFPFWRDPAARNAVQQELARWGLANGYTRDELRTLSDHRHIVTMMKGLMWDRMAAGAVSAPAAAATDRQPVPGLRPGGAQAAAGAAAPLAAPDVARAEAAFGERTNLRNATQLLSARRRAAAADQGGG